MEHENDSSLQPANNKLLFTKIPGRASADVAALSRLIAKLGLGTPSGKELTASYLCSFWANNHALSQPHST